MCIPSSESVTSRTCLFCLSPITGTNSSGRPLLCCSSCSTHDVPRPPFSIPLSVNPLHASSLASTVLSLTYPLRNGSWNPAPLWGFFLYHGKGKTSRSQSKSSNNSKRSLCRSLVFRGQFSSVISLLDGTDLAQNSLETVRKLELLHPVEPPFIIEKTTSNFWLDSPITKNEVSNAILKAKGGKAAGPSALSFDHLKATISHSTEICDDLAVFYNLICQCPVKCPHALKSSRLVALNKNDGGVRPIAVGEVSHPSFCYYLFRQN
ncbi:hypothetical protein GEMRC1_009516 [Eukaryota sp. GEM-RC1]